MLDGITYTSTAQINFDLLTYMIGSYHYNWHEQIELIWLLKGTVEANVDGRRYTMHENDLVLINTNCGHATFALSSECIAMRLHITPAFLLDQGVDLDHGAFQLNSVKRPQHHDYDLIRQILAQLSLGLQHHHISQFDMNALYFRLTSILLHDFFDTTAKISNQPQRRQGSLSRVITYINKTYDQNITLDTAAKVSHYSTAYLSRIFKAELGVNFYEYLTRCRLQHAVFALEDPETKIADIALNNGFKEVKSFNLMFKKHFGQTPSAYRNHLSLSARPQIDQFKQPLSTQQETWLTNRLTEWMDVTAVDQLSACDTCGYREHFAEYQALKSKVDQLKLLLNH
ncbi:helix-turn-helix transcriptional regulator [Secundilactobacillus collinoides]|uniref:Transcription regulator n=2 Tax=Secundilactobacillus collinoides TaxID=33960 RepID=A0A0R2BDD5_SECCO|nr:AraC family transcriptional regulator [Secundilactobacillus collinoides]KRM77759.1 transcription regulator [Secundilactobacillus collinoides DSM 20515 = JCM 1123]KZL38932.1 AraC family transcriptional regulator [Secundilactobacillus collinoides]